jgi:hypothetical protein
MRTHKSRLVSGYHSFILSLSHEAKTARGDDRLASGRDEIRRMSRPCTVDLCMFLTRTSILVTICAIRCFRKTANLEYNGCAIYHSSLVLIRN